MQKGYVLRTDADFDNAILFRLPVEVWQDGSIIDYGGLIQSHTDNTVLIDFNRYLKAVCEFRVR